VARTRVTTDVITDLAVTAAKLAATLDLSSKTITLPDTSVTAAMLASTLNLSSKTLTLPAANTPAFTKSYTSANQTITSGGSLTLAHSLGAMPALVQLRLKCTTGEGGYSIGDETIVAIGTHVASANRGIAVVPDATNLNVRFGSDGNAMCIHRKDTGAIINITNASWAAIFKAWV
jgi:hypothetical protein